MLNYFLFADIWTQR